MALTTAALNRIPLPIPSNTGTGRQPQRSTRLSVRSTPPRLPLLSCAGLSLAPRPLLAIQSQSTHRRGDPDVVLERRIAVACGLNEKDLQPQPQEEEVAFEHLEFGEKDLESDESTWDLYQRWMRHYHVFRDPGEQQVHLNAFKENAKYIIEWRRKHSMYSLFDIGLNSHSDKTEDELVLMMGGPYPPADFYPVGPMVKSMTDMGSQSHHDGCGSFCFSI